MKSGIIEGFTGAWSLARKAVVATAQLIGLFAFAAVMFPLFVVGAIAGLAWVALCAGFVSWESVADWVTAGKATWRIQITPTQPEPPQ